MCIEDVRLGRKKRTAFRFVLLLNGQNTLLAANDPKRTSITFSCVDAGWYYLSNQQMTSNGEGMLMPQLIAPKTFTIEEHGQSVTKTWYAWTDLNQYVSILEVFLDEE